MTRCAAELQTHHHERMQYVLCHRRGLYYGILHPIYMNSIFAIQKFIQLLGGIPYTAHGAQIPPPLIFYFHAYIRLGKGQICPRELEKSCGQGPAWLEPPAGAKLEINEKSKIGGEVICAIRAQYGKVPVASLLKTLKTTAMS